MFVVVACLAALAGSSLGAQVRAAPHTPFDDAAARAILALSEALSDLGEVRSVRVGAASGLGTALGGGAGEGTSGGDGSDASPEQVVANAEALGDRSMGEMVRAGKARALGWAVAQGSGSLGYRGAQREEALLALSGAASGDDQVLKHAAGAALDRAMGAARASAIRALSGASSDSSVAVRQQAAKSLRRLLDGGRGSLRGDGSDAVRLEAVEALIKDLGDRLEMRRLAAARQLGQA